MIDSSWQSNLVLVAGAALGLAATFIAIVLDTAGRLKGSGNSPVTAPTPSQ